MYVSLSSAYNRMSLNPSVYRALKFGGFFLKIVICGFKQT